MSELQQKPEDYSPEVIELAKEAIEQCRASLMLTYRFMDAALWRMDLQTAPILKTLSTNGLTLWFNPVLVLHRYQQDPHELTRDLLHCFLHCILRHPFDKTHENTRAWWLACDITVEEIALEMADISIPSGSDELRKRTLEDLRSSGSVITPERLYDVLDTPLRRLSLQGPEAEMPYKNLEALFVRDDHAHWPQFREDAPESCDNQHQESSLNEENEELPHIKAHSNNEYEENTSQSNASQDDSERDQDQDASRNESTEDRNQDQNQGQDKDTSLGSGKNIDPSEVLNPDQEEEGFQPDDTLSSEQIEQAEQEWNEISKRMQEDLETYSRSIGSATGFLLANMTVVNRKPVDYRDFLRRFATCREDIKINDDEFDYIFYTYGLDAYGNMPLIEPLEYQESERVRDFVIAIDTSGSTAGNLVQNFIDRTFQILSETQTSGNKVNLHIIQCDTDIREDIKVTSLEELNRLRQNFIVKGMGGTDFRPVFNYVDELIQQDEFDDLRGLIYFTDGFGTFPKKAPDYDTAFVFVEDAGESRYVPPWAMKVVLRNEQLKML